MSEPSTPDDDEDPGSEPASTGVDPPTDAAPLPLPLPPPSTPLPTEKSGSDGAATDRDPSSDPVPPPSTPLPTEDSGSDGAATDWDAPSDPPPHWDPPSVAAPPPFVPPPTAPLIPPSTPLQPPLPLPIQPPPGEPSYLSAFPEPEPLPAVIGGERRDHRRPLPAATPVRGRRPPLWLVLLLLVAFEIPAIISALRHLPHLDTGGVLVSGIIVGEAIGLGVVTVVVLVGRYARAVGWIPQPGVRRSVRGIGIGMVLASVALVAASASELGWPASTVTVLAVNVLMVGLFEETMLRGMLWAALPARWSAARVLLVTSVLFGAWHILNGLVTGNWGAALQQAVFASFLGLALGALRLRSGWLGLSVLVHASLDAAVTAGQLVAARPHAAQALRPTTIVSLLAFEAFYVTLGITGVVVLVRTFLAERRVRRDLATGDPRYAPPVG